MNKPRIFKERDNLYSCYGERGFAFGRTVTEAFDNYKHITSKPRGHVSLESKLRVLGVVAEALEAAGQATTAWVIRSALEDLNEKYKVVCPECRGSKVVKQAYRGLDTGPTATCHRCHGEGEILLEPSRKPD
jgi:hypothetical protein